MKKLQLELNDLCAILTLANVVCIIAKVPFASVFGLANCCIGFVGNIKRKAHLNAFIMNIAIIVLNIYFWFFA